MKLLSQLLFLFLATNLFGQNQTLQKQLSGADIAVNGELQLADPEYGPLVNFQALYVPNQFLVESPEVMVRLRWEDTEREYFSQAWSLQVDYQLEVRDELYNPQGQATVENGSLTIDFHPTDDYTDISLKAYDAIYGHLTVTSVTCLDGGGSPMTIPDDVQLELVYSSNRHHWLDETQAPELHTQIITNNGLDNELELSWNYLSGASEYDVEWLFVDEGSEDGSVLTIPYDWADATRITTSANHYNLSLAYPPGVLIYRVRGVGAYVEDNYPQKRKEAAWSYEPTTLNTVQALTDNQPSANQTARQLSGLEPGMNWNYAVSYAENGKHKEILSLFDGSLRERQTVTVINSDDHAVVGEARYDHQGRAAVAISPVPVGNEGMRYYKNGSGQPFHGGFTREDFDKDLQIGDPNASGYTGPLALPAASRTSEYYSAANPLNSLFKDYIPEADGFAYVQTQFTSDGTNRVARQGSVGSEFKVDGDHATQYYYGTPTQSELDRLFGSEVGHNRFYEKHLVLDPNRQASVKYVDQAGRTIATALSGPAPANLQAIDHKPASNLITDDLLAGNNEPQQDGSIESHHELVVAQAGRVDNFSYSLTGEQHCDNCLLTPCVDCRYDIQIVVTNASGNEVAKHEFLNVTAQAVHNFSVTYPDAGTYSVTKTLTINEDEAQAYKQAFQDYILNNKTTQTCVPYTAPLPVVCNTDCDSECDAAYVGTDAQGNTIYYDADGNYKDINGVLYTVNSPEHTGAIATCKAECNQPDLDPCAIRLAIMKQDMSPGGQYFDNTSGQYLYDQHGRYQVDNTGEPIADVNYDPNHWLVNGNHLDVPTASTLLDEFNNDPGVTTVYADWDAVKADWQDSYADILLPYHPEYCAYSFYCLEDFDCVGVGTVNISESNTYDENMMVDRTDAFAATNAFNTNFLNPTGITQSTTTGVDFTGDKSAYQPQPANLGVDPLMGCVSTNYNFNTDINSLLQNFVSFTTVNTSVATTYSIWYVLDDPHGIGGTTNPDLPQEIQELFDALHGTNGLLASGGPMTKYEFFRGVYSFYKQYLLYNYFTNNALCTYQQVASIYDYWDNDSDDDGFTDGDNYRLIFPKNPLFDNFDPLNYTTSSLQTLGDNWEDETCEDNCSNRALAWIDELQPCITAAGLSQLQIENLKNDLISICELGCDQSNSFMGSSQGDGSTAIPVPNGTATDFDGVIAAYMPGCSVSPEHPVDLETQAACQVDKLETYIGTVSPAVVDWQNPTATELTNITNQANLDWSTAYTSTEVEEWIDYATGVNSTYPTHWPQPLECPNCKCNNLQDFIFENNLAADPIAPTLAERTDIADELNDLLGTTYNEADVADWISVCDGSSA